MNTLQMVMDLQQSYDKVKECNKVLKDGTHIYFLKKLKVDFEQGKDVYVEKERVLDQIKAQIAVLCRDKKIEKKKLEDLDWELRNAVGKDEEYNNVLKIKIEDCKHHLKELEDRSTALLEKEEKYSIEKEIIRSNLVNLKDNFYSYKDVSNKKINKAQKEMEKAKHTIHTLEILLPENLVSEVKTLNKEKNNAVAKLHGTICGDCKKKVSPLVMDSIYRGQEIVRCDNCNKILYYSNLKALKPAK